MTDSETLNATRVFTWDVLPKTTVGGAACGASEKRGNAIGALLEAMCLTPEGTRGIVKIATVSVLGDVVYDDESIVMEAHREAANSMTVWLR